MVQYIAYIDIPDDKNEYIIATETFRKMGVQYSTARSEPGVGRTYKLKSTTKTPEQMISEFWSTRPGEVQERVNTLEQRKMEEPLMSTPLMSYEDPQIIEKILAEQNKSKSLLESAKNALQKVQEEAKEIEEAAASKILDPVNLLGPLRVIPDLYNSYQDAQLKLKEKQLQELRDEIELNTELAQAKAQEDLSKTSWFEKIGIGLSEEEKAYQEALIAGQYLESQRAQVAQNITSAQNLQAAQDQAAALGVPFVSPDSKTNYLALAGVGVGAAIITALITSRR